TPDRARFAQHLDYNIVATAEVADHSLKFVSGGNRPVVDVDDQVVLVHVVLFADAIGIDGHYECATHPFKAVFLGNLGGKGSNVNAESLFALPLRFVAIPEETAGVLWIRRRLLPGVGWNEASVLRFFAAFFQRYGSRMSFAGADVGDIGSTANREGGDFAYQLARCIDVLIV